MYSKQGNLLAAAFDTLGDRVAADIFFGLLGQCQGALEHQGTLALLTTQPVGATQAAYRFANYAVPPDDKLTIYPSNGPTASFEGRVDIDGIVLGGIGWAKANADWHDFNLDAGGNRDAWRSYVDCVQVLDRTGTAIYPSRTIRVYLNRTAMQDPNVRTGDTIPFRLDTDGTALCTLDFFDGKVGNIRDLIGTASDYSSGLRGWFLASGSNGTTDLGGALVLYGYTGAGDYATVGASVAASATISGSGTLGGTTTTDGEHSHAITNSVLITAFTLSSYTITFGADFTGNTGVTETQTLCFSSVTSANPHNHTVSAAGGLGASIDTNDGGEHSHDFELAGSAIASLLSASDLRPAGVVVVRIQRVT